MDERADVTLAERVERLEKEAEQMREQLRLEGRRLNLPFSRARQTVPQGEPPQRRVPASVAAPVPETSREARGEERGGGAARGGEGFFGWLPFDLGDYRSGEWWLGKIGIGLLLFGVAFLYLLSVEHGWITPTVRVAFGLALGATLTTLGLRATRTAAPSPGSSWAEASAFSTQPALPPITSTPSCPTRSPSPSWLR